MTLHVCRCYLGIYLFLLRNVYIVIVTKCLYLTNIAARCDYMVGIEYLLEALMQYLICVVRFKQFHREQI
jgi:hypothetical protein